MALAAAWPGAAWPQDAGQARFWSIQPSLSIQQVVTDNYRLSGVAVGDAITELGAGLRLAGQGANVRGTLDYQLTGLAYARHSDENTIRHQLIANAKAEVVEGAAFVDMRASVTEQAVSSFGVLSVDGERPNTNKDRVLSLWVAPYTEGRAGNLFDYRASLRQETARFRERGLLGYDRTSAGLNLVGGGAPFSWTFDANQQRTRFRFGDHANESAAAATLRYQVGTDLRFGASAGVESNDFAADPVRGRPTYGLSADWTPSVRTEVRLTATKQFFGTSHDVELKHRFERLVVSFIDRRDLSTTGIRAIPSSEELNRLVAQQFAGGTTNPTQVDFAARDFLRTNGIDPDAQAISGFVANTATVGRTQTLSAVWSGLRTSASVRIAQGWTEQLQGVAGPVADFQFSRVLRQRGILGDVAYNPSPVSTISLNGSWQRNTGDDATLTTQLKSLGLSFQTRPSTKSSWAAGLRYTVFAGPADSYRERAGYLAYRLQF